MHQVIVKSCYDFVLLKMLFNAIFYARLIYVINVKDAFSILVFIATLEQVPCLNEDSMLLT